MRSDGEGAGVPREGLGIPFLGHSSRPVFWREQRGRSVKAALQLGISIPAAHSCLLGALKTYRHQSSVPDQLNEVGARSTCPAQVGSLDGSESSRRPYRHLNTVRR